ncbi:GMC family oxidoreductase N-terminal domain-containing protein [Brevibacillus brevis]|uniref:GMC family oxidoreductase N-terminal domain-containing protein n=1 Tax=Brevibacillus brevis TaxID=1393 RepID=UPI003F513510
MTTAGQGANCRKLQVFFKSTVLRVLFKNKRAIGVEFLKEGKCVRAYSRKKVIISAGINSSQLLMLSGIGPAKMLKDEGIPVVFANPHVGKGLRNHTLNFAEFSANPKDNPLPEDDPNALFTGGAFLPDPTPGSNKTRRAVQLIGIGSKGKLTVAILFLKPKSRGSIKIQSNDPLKIVLADDSIIPFTVDGNTSAPAYLIGNTITQQLVKQNARDNKKR